MYKGFLFNMMLLIFIHNGITSAQVNDFTEREVKRLEQKLGLTVQQIDRVKEILKANLAEIEQLREQNRGNREAIRTAEKDIEDTMRGQIRAVLSAEQEQKFAEIKETIKLPRPGHDERMKKMNERLKLTGEQSAQIEEIMTESRNKMESIREQHGSDRESMRTEMQKIRKETDRKIEDILTAEQKKEYQKMKDENDKEMRGPRPGMGEPRRGF